MCYTGQPLVQDTMEGHYQVMIKVIKKYYVKTVTHELFFIYSKNFQIEKITTD